MIATASRKSKAPWTLDRWEEFAGRCRALRDGLAAYHLDLRGIGGDTGRAILAIGGARGAHQWALVRAADVFKAQHPDRADDLPVGLALDIPGVDDKLPPQVRPKAIPTRDEWEEFGRRLKRLARDASGLLGDFQETARANKVRSAAFLATCDRIGSTKVALDSVVCSQQPDWPGAIKVFYGAPDSEPSPTEPDRPAKAKASPVRLDAPQAAPSVAIDDGPADPPAVEPVATTGPPRAKAGPVRLDPGVAYELASRHRMPFGQYKDRTLADIASTDDGLDYLGWLVGRKLLPPLRKTITTFLNGRVDRPSGPEPSGSLDAPSKNLEAEPLDDGTANDVIHAWAGMR